MKFTLYNFDIESSNSSWLNVVLPLVEDDQRVRESSMLNNLRE